MARTGPVDAVTARRNDRPGLAVAPELCIVIPVLNERDDVAPLVDRLRAVLAGVAWEAIFVDDDFRRRHARRGGGDRAAGCAGAAAAPHRPPRPLIGLHRGRAGQPRPLRRRDGRRPAARRGAAAAHARRAARRRLRGRGRQPLRRRGRCGRLGPHARRHVRPGDPAEPADPARPGFRPDERLLHDPPHHARRRRARPVGDGVQDPARPAGLPARPAETDRTALRVPQPGGRREQARCRRPARTTCCC